MNLAIMVVAVALAIVTARRQFPVNVRRAAWAALWLLLLLTPFVNSNPTTLFAVLVAMLNAQGWNIIGGFTGYGAFGNVAWVGLGAYIAGGFMSKAEGHTRLPFWFAIPLAAAITGLVAMLIGLAVLRLRGHYFSIATLGVSIAMPQIIRVFDDVVNWVVNLGAPGKDGAFALHFFNGDLPLNFPLTDDISVFGQTISRDAVFYYEALGLAAAGVAFTWWLARSKFGYGLLAIRENEEAAEVMGINTTLYKVAAYGLSAVLAGLGGAMLGYQSVNLLTDADAPFFNNTTNLEMIIICLLGGLGTVWGPFIGAFVLYAIREALVSTKIIPDEWQLAVFALIIILVVLFLPRGLMQLIRTQGRLSWRIFAQNIRENRV